MIAVRTDAQIVFGVGFRASGPVATRITPARVVALTLAPFVALRADAARVTDSNKRNQTSGTLCLKKMSPT